MYEYWEEGARGVENKNAPCLSNMRLFENRVKCCSKVGTNEIWRGSMQIGVDSYEVYKQACPVAVEE